MCDTYDHMGVSINGGPPNGWFTRGNPVKMDDLGVPHFRKCPYSDEVVKQLISGGAPSRRLCRLFVPLADPPAHRYHQSSHSVARLPAPPMALAQGCRESWDVPSGIHRKKLLKMAICSWLTHETCRFSMVMLVYQRVHGILPKYLWIVPKYRYLI